MRVSLDRKTFSYFKRMELTDHPDQAVIEKLRQSGPMTRQCCLAELARREGATVVRTRSS
jgi:hypothetical protein